MGIELHHHQSASHPVMALLYLPLTTYRNRIRERHGIAKVMAPGREQGATPHLGHGKSAWCFLHTSHGARLSSDIRLNPMNQNPRPDPQSTAFPKQALSKPRNRISIIAYPVHGHCGTGTDPMMDGTLLYPGHV